MSIIQTKEDKIDYPMSRERYLSTWKIFRNVSDENRITGNHIVSLESWKNVTSFLDLGCGDGLIATSIVLNSPEEIQNVILVDPDSEMLNEAYQNIANTHKVQHFEKHLSKFENCFEVFAPTVDLILAVHLVYLITPEAFHYLIDRLPIGKKLIIVLDDKDSIFTKLWERTAPKYVQKSEHVRNYLENNKNGLSVKKSVVTSRFSNPLIQASHVKDALLSLMSYSDYSLMNNDSKRFVEACIYENLKGDYIECNSACYEIRKLGS